MSTINVTNLKGRGGASPNLPDGANVTGVLTATSFVGSGANLTGLANTDFINAEQVTVVGVVTAGSYRGDGSSLTGVGESIAPWHYNPDVNDIDVTVGTGIGITFNKKVLAGSGTATLKIVNAGVAGTVHQSWGISSATFNVTEFTLGALVSSLTVNETYQVDIPSGFIVDGNETSYAGTAYTFSVQDAVNKLWSWGDNAYGRLGHNQAEATVDSLSSPVQIPGTNWKSGWQHGNPNATYNTGAVKTDGTLWMWGLNEQGQLGQNDTVKVSSPTQIPGTTWSLVSSATYTSGAIKTDGTLWMWGRNTFGQIGDNTQGSGSATAKSSPVQIPGTTWRSINIGHYTTTATKTDNTLWIWGRGESGVTGQNQPTNTNYSSPVQIPGTTWKSSIQISDTNSAAIKTDGTLWTWGGNDSGVLGINNNTKYSSPVQVPGTTWAAISGGMQWVLATKTDGTLWGWGEGGNGELAQNNELKYSSPVQVPGTWGTNELHIFAGRGSAHAIKADGTLWSWGYNASGGLGQNNLTRYSSPVQVGSNTDWHEVGGSAMNSVFAIQKDQTP
jgi:alpha-tubulin suppressor-like RCC1 family protein